MTGRQDVSTLLAAIAGPAAGHLTAGYTTSSGGPGGLRHPAARYEAIVETLDALGRTSSTWVAPLTMLDGRPEPANILFAVAETPSAIARLRAYEVRPNLWIDAGDQAVAIWRLARPLDAYAAGVACRRLARATGCTITDEPAGARIPVPGSVTATGGRVALENGPDIPYDPAEVQLPVWLAGLRRALR